MSRDQRKQLIAKMRVALKQRDMTEGEARMFWQTFLDATADIELQIFERTCNRVILKCEWFPTVAEFRKHASAVRDIHGPTREELMAQQQRLLADHKTRWTREELERARAGVDPNSLTGPILLRALDAVEVE